MSQLVDPIYLAIKASVACTLAVLLVTHTATKDSLSAGFVALICTSPSVHGGLRRGLEQVVGTLVGALAGGLPEVLWPAARGAPWALLPGLAAALLFCFRAGLGATYVVTGFTVLYFHTMPFASPDLALEARGVSLAAGIGAALLVNAAVSSLVGPRITARRLAVARASVAASLRSLAARADGAAPSFEAAFAAVAELHADLTAAARERFFPGALRARVSALAGISHAIALEETAHLGKEIALLAGSSGSLRPLLPLLARAAEALEAGSPDPALAPLREAVSEAYLRLGEPVLASATRRLGQSVERAL